MFFSKSLSVRAKASDQIDDNLEKGNEERVHRDEKKSITKFYEFYEEHVLHLKSVMSRENSIQLVYQLSILIHNFLNYPVIELVYQNKTPGVPTAQWATKLTLLCISSLLSMYSTFSLPITASKMRSLKELGLYCTIPRNLCMLSKSMFHFLCHIFTTYVSVFLLLESDRFLYLRQYISEKTGEEYYGLYGFIIYGSIIFCVFPLLLILENFLAVTIMVIGQSRNKVRTILSRFKETIRIRVSKPNLMVEIDIG